jgi:hypothetical protein
VIVCDSDIVYPTTVTVVTTTRSRVIFRVVVISTRRSTPRTAPITFSFPSDIFQHNKNKKERKKKREKKRKGTTTTTTTKYLICFTLCRMWKKKKKTYLEVDPVEVLPTQQKFSAR